MLLMLCSLLDTAFFAEQTKELSLFALRRVEVPDDMVLGKKDVTANR